MMSIKSVLVVVEVVEVDWTIGFVTAVSVSVATSGMSG